MADGMTTGLVLWDLGKNTLIQEFYPFESIPFAFSRDGKYFIGETRACLQTPISLNYGRCELGVRQHGN